MNITVKAANHGVEKMLNNLKRFENNDGKIRSIMERYGQSGVEQLAEATPKKTGLTSESWTYTINKSKSGYELVFNNTNVVDGANVAILIQYGHGTGWGGYVQGTDYINPVIEPLFQSMVDEINKLYS